MDRLAPGHLAPHRWQQEGSAQFLEGAVLLVVSSGGVLSGSSGLSYAALWSPA